MGWQAEVSAAAVASTSTSLSCAVDCVVCCAPTGRPAAQTSRAPAVDVSRRSCPGGMAGLSNNCACGVAQSRSTAIIAEAGAMLRPKPSYASTSRATTIITRPLAQLQAQRLLPLRL